MEGLARMTFTVLVRSAEGRLALTERVSPRHDDAAAASPARMIEDARLSGCTLAIVLGSDDRLLNHWRQRRRRK